MGWALDKKFFHNDLKKGCYDEDEEDDEYGSDASGYTSSQRPDGGWGWVVLFAAFTLNLIVDGIGVTFGQVQDEYIEIFNASRSDMSLVGSSLTGCYLIIGPVAGMMCFHMSLRKVTILGSVVASIGFILSSQVTTVEWLIVTYGIIGGMGLGMMYLPSIVCVSYWFDKRLSLATGVAVCGSGVGQFIFGSLNTYLMDEYMWQGKHLLYGAIALHGVVCGAVFRSPTRLHHGRHKQCRQRVEIERGAIMKALIEDKKRQRTISDGSLDNCVITTNNRLIKIEPLLLQCKTQALRKMLRQLGYSIQSLAVSKTSLQQSDQRILMEALQQQQQNKTDNSSGTSGANSKNQIHLPSSGQLPKRNSSPDFNKVSSMEAQPVNGFVSRSNSINSNHKVAVALNNNAIPTVATPLPVVPSLPQSGGTVSSGTSTPVKKFPKTKSCDVLAQHVIKKLMSERVRSNSECVTAQSSSPGLKPAAQMFPLGSSPAIPCCGGSLDISIQEIPPSEATSCYASNTSIATDVSSQFARDYVPNSSRNSYVATCMINGEQLEASIRELSSQKSREKSKIWQLLYMVYDLLKLACNPVFTLFLISSFFTLMAHYIPYAYIPNLGKEKGFLVSDAELLPAVISVTSTLGRLIVGWLGDRPWFNSLFFNNAALIFSGLLCFILPLFETVEMMYIVAALLGLCLATFVALRSVLLVKFLGVENIPKTFGMMCLVMGIGVFVGIYLTSVVGKISGSWDNTFYLAGGFMIISGVILCPVRYLKKRDDRRAAVKQAQEETDTDSFYLDPASGIASPVHSRV